MQFFVRSAVGDHVIDYFVLNFALTVEDTSLSNQRIDGAFFGSDVTFIVSFNLACVADFYGPDCSIYCHPANSSDMGHYTCLSDGSRQCLPGYLNETTNCTSCVPADGCSKSTTDTTCTCDQDIFPHTQRMEFAVSQESVTVYQAMGESSVMKVNMSTVIYTCCVAVNGIYSVHMISFNSSLYYCCSYI